jgi:O-antigen/teichoic acid export membrane protein
MASRAHPPRPRPEPPRERAPTEPADTVLDLPPAADLLTNPEELTDAPPSVAVAPAGGRPAAGRAARWLWIGSARALVAGTLFRSSSVYIVSNLANRALPFLLLPVLTRYLSPEDFGRTAMFTLAVSLASPLVGLSSESAIARQYFERDRVDFPSYITNCLYVGIATTLLMLGGVLLLADPMAAALSLPASWIWTVVALAVGKNITNIVLVLWQVQQQPRRYGVYYLMQTALTFAVSLALIIGAGYGWTGRVIGELTSVAVCAAAGVVVLVRGRWIKHGINLEYVKHAIRYGGGLLPHLYGALLVVASDRVLITRMVGVAETGLYAVGAQVGMIIGVLEHSFNQAWSPWLFDKLKRNQPRELRLVVRITRLYNVAILALAFALSGASAWLLPHVVGPEFREASQFVLWLALGNAFSGMYKMVVNQVFYVNKTYLLSWITLGTGLANVVLNYALIRVNGAVGSAQATALALFLSYVCTAYLSHRLVPLPAVPFRRWAPWRFRRWARG